VLLAKKVGWSVVTILFVVTFNFFLFRVLPGDPAKAGVRDPRLSPAAVEAARVRFGLDKPVFLNTEEGNPLDSQYFRYLGALADGDLGTSYAFNNRPVTSLIGQALRNTVWLILPAQVLSIIGGVALGLWAAWRRGTRIDLAALTFSLFMWALPTFFLGILLLFFGSRYLGFPSAGRVTIGSMALRKACLRMMSSVDSPLALAVWM